MASKLKAKSPELSVPTKPKVLISGPPGVGKTLTCLDFPQCFFADHEGGAKQPQYTAKLLASGAGYFGPEDGSMDMGEVLTQARALHSEQHGYKTIVHDSITKLVSVTTADESERLERAGKKDEFGASKKPAVAAVKKLLALYSKIDMTVIFIAHTKAEWGIVDGVRAQIGETFDCGYDKLAYELDLWINIEKQGPERIMRVKKSRIASFVDGQTYPWSYDTFAQMYGREIIEGSVKPVELASAQSVADLKRYRELGVITEEDEAKIFKAFKVSDYDELNAVEAAKCIDRALEKLKGQ